MTPATFSEAVMNKTRSQAAADGEKKYFTGKPCQHGHIAERRTRDGFCIECRKKHEKSYMRIYLRNYKYERKDDRTQYFIEYDKKRDSLKKLSRQILNKALKNGKISKKACLKCGSLTTEAHHPDYNKPLDVIWLCRIHHAEIHYPSS